MKKALVIIGDHPKFVEMTESIKSIDEVAEEKIEEVKKQIEAIEEKQQQDRLAVWGQIEEELKSMGKLPEDYSDEKYGLGFNREGVLYIEARDSKGDAGKMAFLAGIKEALEKHAAGMCGCDCECEEEEEKEESKE